LVGRREFFFNYIISSLFFDILVLDSIFLLCYFHLHLQYMTMPIWQHSLRTELKLYGVRSPTLAGDASRMGNTTVGTGIVFGEDHTLEDMFQPQVGEQTDTHKLITIVAPAGTLGVMFNNPLGNLPIVLAIKENSALRGKLMVGDMLVSVDEVDCQGMTSSLLSTFLNSRSRNPQRVFTLARNSTAVAI